MSVWPTLWRWVAAGGLIVVPGVVKGPAGVVGLAVRALGLWLGGAGAGEASAAGIMAVAAACCSDRWMLAADGEAAG